MYGLIRPTFVFLNGCMDCVRTTISVLRDGKRTALVYTGGPPEIELWTIEKAFQGVSSQVVWRKVGSHGPKLFP